MNIRRKTLIYLGLAAAAAAGLAVALRPSPILVETSPVVLGPLEVTTDELGETRTHDRFVVAAPVAGRLLRVLLRDGDSVAQGQLVATMAPLPLSARERDELQARVAAADSTQRGAHAQLKHVTADLAQARRERQRLATLFSSDATSKQELEQAQNAVIALENDVEASRYRAQSAAADLQAARAGLIALEDSAHIATLTIRAPATGHILRVLEPSERVIASGTPILVVGDLKHLEIILEMLSSEAVRVAPGMPALLEGWGGNHPLRAQVRLVEPYAFTKTSALGVEEKRTNVILDFVDAPGQLGDGYRVTGRIILWSAPNVLKAPLSALYRCGSAWCAFVMVSHRAYQRVVEVGHQGNVEVEILSGLKVDDLVIRHPPNELTEGSRVISQK
jgi:HlyD family secretion protein